MGLQFSWIEANLLGFFLVDVRNSRGKFDEIKEEFAINPAPIASQSSLNARGSRWTRDLPKIRLIYFTNWSKVEEQEEEHRFLKRILAQKSWPFDAVVGEIWWGRGSDSLGRHRGFNLATNRAGFSGELAPIVGRSGHDRTAIVSHDRGSLLIAAVWSSSIAEDGSTSSNSIARPMEIGPSRCLHAVLLIAGIAKDRHRQMKLRPLKRDEIVMQIGRFWCFHVSSGKPIDRCQLFRFFARAIISDRVDSSPRDQRSASPRDQRSALVVRCLRCGHVTCNRKHVGT